MSYFTYLKRLVVPALFIALLIIGACHDNPSEPVYNNVIAGTITDEQDNAVPEALIEVFNSSASIQALISKDITDEDGNFVLKNLPEDLSELNIRITHQDFKQYEESLPTVLGGKDKNKLPIKLCHEDTCCGLLDITVIKQNDSTVLSGVEVRINRGDKVIRKAKTDDGGKVVFERVCPGNYWFRIAKEGYKVIEQEFRLDDCDTLAFVFALEEVMRDSCCNGVAVITPKDKETGELLKGSLVKVWRDGKVLQSKTIEDGPAVFLGMCQGTYGFNIFKEGYKSIEFSVEFGCDDTLNIEKLMDKDTCCNGIILFTVKDSLTGTPIEGVNVRLWLNDKKIKNEYTDANGFIKMQNICEGEYQISFLKEGWLGQEFKFTMKCNETLTFDKQMLQKEKDTCCEGVIKIFPKDKESGEPLNGATVKMFKDGKLITSKKAEGGVAVFGELCMGNYSFNILMEKYKGIEFVVELGCNETMEITKELLKEQSQDSCCNGKIKVMPKDKESGEPLNGATVKLYKDGKLLTYKKSEGGYALFEKLCMGEYQINILMEKYKGIEFKVVLGCDEVLEITKELEKEIPKDTCCRGVIILTVKDSQTDAPLKSVTAKLRQGSTIKQAKYTDDAGKAIFYEVCMGDYNFYLARDGYTTREVEFNIGCNDTLYMTEELVAKSKDTCYTAIMKLKVTELVDSTQVPIEGATVKVYIGDNLIKELTTNAEGWAAADGLRAPTNYRIVISKDGYETKTFEWYFKECTKYQETVIITRQ